MITDATAELDQRIAGIVSVPPMPPTLAAVQDMLDSVEGTTAPAAAALLQDADLSRAAERLTGTAFYGPASAVSNPTTAWARLEPKALRNLAAQASLLHTFGEVPGIDGFRPSSLWNHSLKTAVACRLLAEYSQIADGIGPDDAYTCGLAHDIGKLLLLQCQPALYASALQLSVTKSIPLVQAELEVFGCQHADVAAVLAREWRLPQAVQSAVRYHHSNTGDARARSRGFLVRVANTLAHLATGDAGDGYLPEVAQELSLQTIGLRQAQRAEILFKAAEAAFE